MSPAAAPSVTHRWRRQRRRQERQVWMRAISLTRSTRRECYPLVNEISLADHQSFYRYFYLSPEKLAHRWSPARQLVFMSQFRLENMQLICRPFLSDTEMVTQPCVASLIAPVMPYRMHFLLSIWGDHQARKSRKRSVSAFTRYGTFSTVWEPLTRSMLYCKHQPTPGQTCTTTTKKHSALCCWLAVMQGTASPFLMLVMLEDSDGGVLANSAFGQALESGSMSLPRPELLPGQVATVPYILLGTLHLF